MTRLLPLCSAMVLAVLGALPAPALAADGEQTPLGIGPRAADGVTTSASGGGLVRTIVGLAVVLCVIYGLHWVLKQVKASKEAHHEGKGLSSMATLPLGPNRSLHLVRAGTEVVLVGVGEGGVTPIRIYSDLEARESGLILPEDDPARPGVSLPALMDAGPVTVPRKVGRALKAGGLRRLVDDARARTVIR